MLKSNITIAPNIYTRSSANIQTDDEFVQQVYGYKALNIIKTRLPKSYTTKLTRTQIEEMKQNVICRLRKNREHSYGKAMVDGKVVWSCRCEHTGCHAYEKCMGLPNAMRIVRGEFPETEQSSKSDKTEEVHGFEYEDCSFEPPHVTVVLPILNEILVESKNVNNVNNANKEKIELTFYPHKAEEFQVAAGKRVLVICENTYETGYLSTMLYKNRIKHRTLKVKESGYTLNRRIADVFWDFCGDVIEKEAFYDRCFVRLSCDEYEMTELYGALFKLCGVTIGETSGLKVAGLVDALNETPELISGCILNMDDVNSPVTIGTLESISAEEEFDEVLLLENSNTALYKAVEELFGSPPIILGKESQSGWVFKKSLLGRPQRVGVDNYTGEPGKDCLNVELGLWGDVDGKSFLTEQVGDSISLQLYIAEKIKEGDELTVEKDSETGGYRFSHDGNVLGQFPPAIIREVQTMEGFPSDFVGFEGIYVRNIVTCISEKDDFSVPPRFRESRIWLGLDITGYAKVLI